MQVLTPSVDLAAFVERIETAPQRVLMLDYDGTLAPFHVDPAQAVPYPDVAAALEDIVQAGGTRVVLVSGRPAEDLPPLLPLTQRPEIWGAHGWERLLPDGSLVAGPAGRGPRATGAGGGALRSRASVACRRARGSKRSARASRCTGAGCRRNGRQSSHAGEGSVVAARARERGRNAAVRRRPRAPRKRLQ